MLTRPGRLPDRHPPHHSGQSLNPATTSHHARLSFTGHQQGFNHVHPSGLPLAHATGVEPATLRLSPELRTPPSPATHVRGRDRPSSTDLEPPLNSYQSISNPVVHSMRATSRRTSPQESLDLRSLGSAKRAWAPGALELAEVRVARKGRAVGASAGSLPGGDLPVAHGRAERRRRAGERPQTGAAAQTREIVPGSRRTGGVR